MARTSRTWTGAETRLLAEYLAHRWPAHRTLQRVRVGRIPEDLPIEGLSPAEVRMLGIWRRWVDAMIVDPPTLWVVEAGIVPDPGDISRVALYLRLLPSTPDLPDLDGLSPRGRLVYGVDDPVLRTMAHEAGFLMETYSPAWVGDYLSRRAAGQRTPPLSQL